MLTVPAPVLVYDTSLPGVAELVKPITVGVGPVLADGVPLTPAKVTASALVIFRNVAPGAPAEAWDVTELRWVTDPAAHPGVREQSFWYVEEPGSPPWQQLVMAAGLLDSSGQPAFAPAVAGYPSYHFRAYFALPSQHEAASSAPSAPVVFVAAGDRDLMVLGPGVGEKLPTATQARLQLKDPGRQVIGGVVIRRATPGAEVTVSNLAGASVVLLPDGSIELRPALGQTVAVAGDLEADRVFALPSGGGPRKQLD